MMGMMDMMMYGNKDWGGGMMQGSFGSVHYGLGLVTWIAVIAFLVAATRYLWQKGGEKK